jgi:hypothetical protein
MRLKNLSVRLIKLPANIELVLYLIKEELKSNKLFNGLAKVGFEDCYYQPHFGTLVLASAGFEEHSDDLYEFYLELISEYSEKIEADNDVIVKCAFNVYVDLMIEKKRRFAQK